MLADLDLLLIAVLCTAEDILPGATKNARRIVTDVEVITLCVAQAIMGIPSDPRFLAVARKRLIHLFPVLPDRAGLYKRREALSDTIEMLIARFAAHSPGNGDDVLLADSTPVECARSRETVKRGGASSLADAISDAADYGYCASHSRFFYGFRLHTLFAMDGTPKGAGLDQPKGRRERGLPRARRAMPAPAGPVPDADRRQELSRRPVRSRPGNPRRQHPTTPPQGRARQRTASGADPPASRVDLLDRQGHPRPRTPRRPHPARLRTRLACRFLALTAAIALNHRLGLPSRALAQYAA